MPLAALVLTDDEAMEASGLTRSTLPVAGQTLVEYQIRMARACGAGHIIMLVDRLPASLVAACDRLRDDGIAVEIARTATEAADSVHPDEQVLIVDAGIVAQRGIIAALAERTGRTVLTLPDHADTAHFERIDGDDRWAGLALLDGQLLRETAAMLGDWTLGPTLLRTALQAGAGRMAHEGAGLALVRSEEDARQIAQLLALGDHGGGAGLWQVLMVDPVVRMALPRLLAASASPDLVAFLAPALLSAAMLAGVFGWIAPSFGLYLLAGFPLAAARIMTDIAARPDRLLHWTGEARMPMLIVLLGFAGWTLNVPGQDWGPIVLALWAGIALILQPRTAERPLWIADADVIALELLMTSLLGQPVLGLLIAVCHAVVSQFWLLRQSW